MTHDPRRAKALTFALPAALLCASLAGAMPAAEPAYEALERKGHELELAGGFLDAQDAFCRALADAATRAAALTHSTPPAAGEEAARRAELLWAWCEVLADKAHYQTYYTSRPGGLLGAFEEARRAADSVATRPARELSSWLTWRLVKIQQSLGEARRAQAESRRLGFVTDWRLAGPFENEQGGGFAVAYGPEEGIDFDAVYPGKKRPVRWRALDVEPVDGVIDLDALFRPNDECVAYAVTYLRSPDRREVELRLASDDGVEVWLNGRKVLSHDVERACFFDQDVVEGAIEAGWNQVLVKIADDHIDWEFSFRVTDRQGAVLRDLEVSAAEVRQTPRAEGPVPPFRGGGAVPYLAGRVERTIECVDGRYVEIDAGRDGFAEAFARATGKDLAPSALRDRDELAAVVSVRTAREWAEALPAYAREIEGAELARLCYGLGTALTSRGAHGVKQHPDRAALQRAVELDPANPAYVLALSRVATDWVVMAAERDENSRVALLRRLIKIAPASAVAHYELASHYLAGQSSPGRALEHVGEALRLAPGFVMARLVEIDACARLGWTEIARAKMERLAAGRPDDPVVQGRWGATLLSAGRAKEAQRAYQVAAKADAGVPSFRRGLEACHLALGRIYAAVDMERRASVLDPFDIEPCMEIARLCEAKEDYAAAAESAQRALALAPDDHAALETLGRALAAIGKTDKAREAWNRALAVTPNFVELEAYIEFLDGKLTYDRRFAEDIAPLLDRARSYVPAGDDPLVEILDKIIDRVNIDGTRSRTTHRVVQIRSNRGVEALGTPYVVYYPDEQVVKVRTARVYRADGAVEDAPTGERGRIVGAGTGRAARVIDLPPLRAGDIVEIEHRVDDTRQSFFGKYYGNIHRFQGLHPRLKSQFILIAPKGREFHFHTRNKPPGGAPAFERRDWLDEDAFVYTWTLDPAPRIRAEPLMAPVEELGLQVQVSTYESWDEFGRWYWNLVSDQHRTSPEIEAKARALAAGARDDIGRIRAVYDFIATDIQYSAWEFGVHGFKPYRATKIFDQRFGDCKDKATLMATMLGGLGVEAHPVLVRSTLARSDEDLTLPLFDHFNHMIAYVPAKDGRRELWLDGTTALHGMESIPAADAGALACVVFPDGGRVMRIPQDGPEGNALVEEAGFDLSRAGEGLAARVTVEARATGWCATFARYQLMGQSPARRVLEQLYARQMPGLAVATVDTTDLRDIGVPVSYGFRAQVRDLGATRRAGSRGDGAGGANPEWFFRPLGSPFRGAFRGEWALLAPEKLADYATLASREQDLVLGSPWRYSNTVTYRLAEGLGFVRVPDDADIETPFGRLRLTYEVKGRVLVASKMIEVTTRRVTPGDYRAFRLFVNRADRAERREIGVGVAPK